MTSIERMRYERALQIAAEQLRRASDFANMAGLEHERSIASDLSYTIDALMFHSTGARPLSSRAEARRFCLEAVIPF